MDKWRAREDRLVEFVLSWRWPLVATMTLTTLIVEIEEHQPSFTHINLPFVREVVLFGLFFPGMVGVMLSLMWKAQRQSELLEGAAEAERQRIARDLHDSLAQELGFLRLRLDQVIADPSLKEAVAIRQQLEQLSSVANLAYEHVRGRLELLQGLPPPDLAAAILKHARMLGQRANFRVNWLAKGDAVALPPERRRQVILILAEALANVEKHAHATYVDMTLVWEPNRMTVTITDDGRGFDGDSLDPQGGLGLSIMLQRALEIGGQLEVSSRSGEGTKIGLLVPIE